MARPEMMLQRLRPELGPETFDADSDLCNLLFYPDSKILKEIKVCWFCIQSRILSLRIHLHSYIFF